MSDITTQVERYRAGVLPFDALRLKLVHRQYPAPERYQDRPDDPYELEAWIDDQPWYTDGTWDEVVRCRDQGLLTPDEYTQISQAFDAAHPRNRDSSGDAETATATLEPMLVYRALSSDAFGDRPWMSLAGTTFRGRSGEHVVVTLAPDGLQESNVVAEIRVPAGIEIARADDLVWLPAGLTYCIDGVRESGGQVVLEVTVVD